jgi:hypothetical protein
VLFRKTGRDIKGLTLVYYCVSIFLFLFVTDEISLGKIQYPLYTLLEFSFFAILIFQQLKFRNRKIILITLSVSFFLFQVIYYFTPQRRKFDSIPIGFEAILIFIFIFFFLYEQLLDVKDVPIYSNYFFWISIGLLIYLGGSLFIYIYANTLSRAEMDQYWFFTYVVEIIKNLLLTSAILVYSKNPNKQKPNQPLPNLDFMV